MGHDHSPTGTPTPTPATRMVRAGRPSAARCSAALALIVAFMVAEVVAGVLAGSLALLSDAAHMLTDAVALGIVAGRRSPRRAARPRAR